jgi:hypothetical protein
MFSLPILWPSMVAWTEAGRGRAGKKMQFAHAAWSAVLKRQWCQ